MLSKNQSCFLKYIKRKSFLQYYKNISVAAISCRNAQTENADDESKDVLTDLPEEDTTMEEIIERKRNKNRLPEFVYKVHIQKVVPELKLKYDFQKKRLRQRYGMYGEASDLNPGILWPTKDELKDVKEFESKYTLPLNEMLQKVKEERELKEQEKRDYEKEVEKNLENYPKLLNEYYAKIAKTQDEAEKLKQKRELLIEEISEYLGYDIDPRDPRFKEAVEKRDKEMKKAQKVKREKENYAKMLQKLTEIAEMRDK